MNCERVKELWDEYRDGQLSGAESRGLEEHLADCPSCESRWRAESGWLAVLGDQAPISTDGEARAFTASVVRRWSRGHEPRIAGRIVRLAAAAAVVALMLSLAALMVQRDAGVTAPPVATAGQPSEALLFAQINAPVVAVHEVFDSTARLLDIDRAFNSVADLLDATSIPPHQPDTRTP